MRKIPLLFLTSLSLVFVACSGSGGSVYHPDVGPFDVNGNYVEALADAPVKKRFFRRAKSKNPASSKPLVLPESKPRLKFLDKSNVQQIAKKAPPKSKASKPLPKKVIVVKSKPSPKRTPSPTKAVVKATAKVPPKSKVKKSVAKSKPKPVKKVVVAKPKTKAPIRHRVAKSDTLYSLSRKYGATISSIQRANGISGTLIRTGQILLIPR